MRISFDVDGCLLEVPAIQNMVRALVHANTFSAPARPFDIIILTSRYKETWGHNTDFKQLLGEFGLSMHNVIFTDGNDKYLSIIEHRIDMHFDDDDHEINLINSRIPSKPGVLVDWPFNQPTIVPMVYNAGCTPFDPVSKPNVADVGMKLRAIDIGTKLKGYR